MKNVEFTRKCVTGCMVDAVRKLKVHLGGQHDPDYEVLRAIDLTALRGERRTAPGEIFIEELVEHVMDKLGHVNQVTGSKSRASMAVAKQLRG